MLPLASFTCHGCSVIRVIIQFLKENRLNASAAQLQAETKIIMNCFENFEEFRKALLEGKWDEVLQQTCQLSLSEETLYLLYEQVCECVKFLFTMIA